MMHVFPGLYPWTLDDFTADEWGCVLRLYDDWKAETRRRG